jgi:hypothetical protein
MATLYGVLEQRRRAGRWTTADLFGHKQSCKTLPPGIRMSRLAVGQIAENRDAGHNM